MSDDTIFADRMLSLGLARVSEAAAIAAAKLVGSGDEKAADQAAVDAMRTQLNLLDIKGTVVIGEGERDEAPMLYIGEEVGTGKGPAVDIALDPLEGTTLTAKDMPNALAVIAMGPRGSMLHAPDVYMDKLAIGPGYQPGLVSLDMTPDRAHPQARPRQGHGHQRRHGLRAGAAAPRGAHRRDPRHRRAHPADHRRRRGRRDPLRRERQDRHRHVHGLGRRARGRAGGGGAEVHGRADDGPAPLPQRGRAQAGAQRRHRGPRQDLPAATTWSPRT